MSRSHPIVLRASAGPRIRSSARATGASHEVGEFFDHALLRSGGDGAQTVALLRTRLREAWHDLLPWAIPTPNPTWRAVAIGAATLGCAGGTVFAGIGWGWTAAALVLGGAALARQLRGDDRRAHRISTQLAAAIEDGASLESLEPQVEELLSVHPDHDGARLLLAVLRLERGEALAALMQLAPLRDHHPDTGEIVLLGAMAYASLGKHRDALRMLEVLNVDADHPWRTWVLRLRDACRHSGGEGTRASSGEDLPVDDWPEDLR